MSASPESSPVKLITEAYLTPSSQPPQSLPADQPAPTGSAATTLWKATRWISSALIGAAFLALAANVYTMVAQERSRRTCALDWVLWATGSDKTFEGALMGKIEDAQRESASQMQGSQFNLRPFDIRGFEMNTPQWNWQSPGGGMPIGGKPVVPSYGSRATGPTHRVTPQRQRR